MKSGEWRARQSRVRTTVTSDKWRERQSKVGRAGVGSWGLGVGGKRTGRGWQHARFSRFPRMMELHFTPDVEKKLNDMPLPPEDGPLPLGISSIRKGRNQHYTDCGRRVQEIPTSASGRRCVALNHPFSCLLIPAGVLL